MIAGGKRIQASKLQKMIFWKCTSAKISPPCTHNVIYIHFKTESMLSTLQKFLPMPECNDLRWCIGQNLIPWTNSKVLAGGFRKEQKHNNGQVYSDTPHPPFYLLIAVYFFKRRTIVSYSSSKIVMINSMFIWWWLKNCLSLLSNDCQRLFRTFPLLSLTG